MGYIYVCSIQHRYILHDTYISSVLYRYMYIDKYSIYGYICYYVDIHIHYVTHDIVIYLMLSIMLYSYI